MGRGGTDNVMHFRANSADNFGVRDKTVVRKYFPKTIFSYTATVVVGRCRNTLNMENVVCVLKSGKDIYNYLVRFGPIVSISDGTGNGMMDTDTI